MCGAIAPCNSLTIIAYIAHMVDVHQIVIYCNDMNIVLVMSDKDTGEILWQTSRQLACNFVKGDAGRALIGRMVDSAIKGVRMSEHKFINCSIDLREPDFKRENPLPFEKQENNKVEVY